MSTILVVGEGRGGTGRTTFSMALAFAAARISDSVLLVDATSDKDILAYLGISWAQPGVIKRLPARGFDVLIHEDIEGPLPPEATHDFIVVDTQSFDDGVAVAEGFSGTLVCMKNHGKVFFDDCEVGSRPEDESIASDPTRAAQVHPTLANLALETWQRATGDDRFGQVVLEEEPKPEKKTGLFAKLLRLR